jgi:hypothetical protein
MLLIAFDLTSRAIEFDHELGNGGTKRSVVFVSATKLLESLL